MEAPPALCLRALTKLYHEGETKRIVLANLDLAVKRGEYIALLGSSGAGKSTLLNLISGIDLPDDGQIWVNGQQINVLPEPSRTLWRRRHVGFVFQFFNLLPTLTAAENVLLPLQLNRLHGASERRRALDLLAQVGLGERQDSFPERLSGGEQQRLAIIRALVHRPTLVLADEPTGNLDNTTGTQVLQLLQQLAREHASTVLLVTHNEAVAGQADRILQLAHGRLHEHPR